MKRFIPFLPFIIFFLLTIFIFRQYIFLGKVPFAGNLLVSLYEPWKTYPSPQYPNGPANKPIGFDSLRIFYPLRSLTIDSFKHFQLPLWNPYDFSGNMQLATYQSAVFFPLTPLFLLLPQIDAWSITVFLEPFLTALFTYFFLRGLSLSKKASTLGALAFGFSGGVLALSEESFMSVYSLMALPILLLGIQKFFQSGKFRWLCVLIFSIVWSIVSGWFQSTLYVLIVAIFWVLFLLFQTKKIKQFLIILVGFGIAGLLSAPHLIPNIESYLYSARGTTDAKFLFDLYLLPPWHLITTIAPDFFGNPGTYNYFGTGFYYEKILYIGIVGLFLSLLSFFKWKKTTEEWFFTVVTLITVSLGLSVPTSWFFLYSLHLPFLSTILPSRIFLISSFSLAVLAGYGFDYVVKKPKKIVFFLSIAILLIAIGLAWQFLLHQKSIDPLGKFATVSYRNMILPTILVGLTILCSTFFLFPKKIYKNIGFILLLAISLGSIIYFSDKYLYFSERQFVYPTTPVVAKLQKISGFDRVWSFGDGYMERNFATYYHLQSPEGYDSFYIRTYGQLLAASQNGGKLTNNIPRADAQLTGVSRLSEISQNPLLAKLLNLLGVKYIFAKKSLADDASFKPLWSDGKYIIYENQHALPRTFLSDSYKVERKPRDVITDIFSPDTDLSSTIILSVDPHLKQTRDTLQGNAKIVSYTPEKVEIQISSNKNALLFLSDNNYPGWEAKVDGKKTTIFTADYTFRSIVVPQGKHTVVFSYHPQSVTIGFVVAGLGVLLFAAVGFTMKKRFT